MYGTEALEAYEFHHSMLVDTERANSFLSALLQTVKPGDIVLDIGSGTGVLACFACQAGAKQVYAMEQGPIIGLAREICARNNLQERITFINDWSTNVALPEPADVLVTETIGNIGFEEGILRWVLDAKKRFLKAGARIIPRTLEMFAVPIESAHDYERIDKWTYYYHNLDFSPLHTVAANNLLFIDLQPEIYLSDPASLLRVDLGHISEIDVSAQASFVVQRQGTLHGFGGWFAAELAPGIHLSNVPPSQTPSWSHSFLPLEDPLEVTAGDRLELTVASSHGAARWQWQVAHFPVTEAGQAASEGNMLPEQTTQSGELSAFYATRDLAHMPVLNAMGEIDRFILQHMNGKLPITEIAQKTDTRFPGKFNNYEDLLEHIYKLMVRYAGAG